MGIHDLMDYRISATVRATLIRFMTIYKYVVSGAQISRGLDVN